MADSEHIHPEQISDPAGWIDRHGDYLMGYAMLRVRDPKVAEDLLQETFLAALCARDRFAGRSSEQSWFVGILKNKIIDHFRKSKREISIDDVESLVDGDDDDFIATGRHAGEWKPESRATHWMPNELDVAERAEFRRFLNICLARLPSQHARAFVLREIDGESPEEVCSIIGIRPTHLRVILYRARKQLRHCLQKNWIETGRASK